MRTAVEWGKENRARHADNTRRSRLKRAYNITPEEYADRAARQGGCAVCGAACPTGKRLAVDHCHATGRVRGLLCMPCNRLIGLAKDDPVLLLTAVHYLEGHVCSPG